MTRLRQAQDDRLFKNESFFGKLPAPCIILTFASQSVVILVEGSVLPAFSRLFLAPKFHLGAFPAPAKFHFAPIPVACRCGIGPEIASTSAFPGETWERGACAPLRVISVFHLG